MSLQGARGLQKTSLAKCGSSMAYNVELSKRAELDLQRIFRFIHAFESPATERWFDGLEDRIQSLSKLPNRGTVTDYDPNLYFLLYGNKPHVYRILYRINDTAQSIVIRHIRHGVRKPL
jgi:plasmid stabilization system protein ParE